MANRASDLVSEFRQAATEFITLGARTRALLLEAQDRGWFPAMTAEGQPVTGLARLPEAIPSTETTPASPGAFAGSNADVDNATIGVAMLEAGGILKNLDEETRKALHRVRV